MMMSKRTFIGSAAALALPLPTLATPLPPPIGSDERLARIAKAQRLMRTVGIGALLIEPGSSLDYFTGVQWRRSERMTAALIPAEGTPCIVTPAFEEPSVRESLRVPAEVRVWNEHESPFDVAAGFLRDRKVTGKLGVEETVRAFVMEGVATASGGWAVSGRDIVRGCRMIKSPAELALMQAAADITIAAFRAVHPQVRAGMTPDDIDTLITAETRKLGGQADGGLVLLGEASAYPHGSHKPQAVREGEVVLLDCGCSVGGYQSDISRSFIFGEPSKDQRTMWEQVRRGQAVAFAAAKIGAPAGSVDDAVRAYYEPLGYGPGYKLPGLPHRTGHGIGMDGHEPVNFVHAETTKLAAGMCFSNEPGLYRPGSFGIRLEDCLYMTEAGPRWFSVPPDSIDKPFG